jgi:hypothetical protein
MRAAPGTDPAWFGIGVVLHAPYAHQLRAYQDYLGAAGVENRPIISGNFVRQPMVTAALPHLRAADFPGAEALHTRGFFIGVHQLPVSDVTIAALVSAMLSFEFKPRRTVLVPDGNFSFGGSLAVPPSVALQGTFAATERREHRFAPHGLTWAGLDPGRALVLHTWPEHGYAAVDLFYCGGTVKVRRAVELLQDRFKPARIKFLVVRRGSQSEVER